MVSMDLLEKWPEGWAPPPFFGTSAAFPAAKDVTFAACVDGRCGVSPVADCSYHTRLFSLAGHPTKSSLP
jgi:hypothetical protein